MTPEQREALWQWCVKQKPYPNGVTVPRLAKVKPIIMRWEYFWLDMAAHLGQLDAEHLMMADQSAYDHMIGNFWGMVVEALYKSTILK